MRLPPQQGEQFAKNTELKGIPQFQDVQRREGERRSTIDQARLSDLVRPITSGNSWREDWREERKYLCKRL